MPQKKRITLHPLLPDGTVDTSVNLYPKTLTTGIVDEEGNEFPPQEKLISGENIKTINNQSLLGSGDIHIEGIETNWGDIGGTLSNQTDLQNVLNNKVSLTGNEEINGNKTFLKPITLYAEDGSFKLFNYQNHFYIQNLNNDRSLEIEIQDSGNVEFIDYNGHYIYLHNIENKQNKVTSLSSSSTDTQYPSAKATWDNLVNVREVAEGKCKSLVLSANATAITSSNFSTQDYKKSDGTDFEDFADFMDYVGAAYESDLHLINADLLSQNDSITLSTASGSYALYYIGYSRYLVLTYEYIEENYKTGDNIYIIELNYPDRWFNITNGEIFLQKLETSKVPLENYPTKAGTETISGNWTYSNPITISGGDGLVIKTSDYHGIFALGVVNVLEFSSGSFWSNVNGFDLGKTGHEFRDIYLTGKLQFSSNHSVYYNGYDLFIKGSTTWFEGTYFVPKTNDSAFLGTSQKKWKDLYLSGSIKGASTLTQAQYDALVSGGTVDADTFYFIEEE